METAASEAGPQDGGEDSGSDEAPETEAVSVPGHDEAVRGRAFCFLPLPTETGLPVHINGFFELSSNRRDIWHGSDMAGAGRLRSEWNVALLEDVVAPSYGQML